MATGGGGRPRSDPARVGRESENQRIKMIH